MSPPRAKVDQAKAARYPDSALRRQLHKVSEFPTIVGSPLERRTKDIYQTTKPGDLLLKFPLFTGGRIINDIKASELFRLAEENRLSWTRDELIFNVSSTFFGILSQERVIDSVRFSLQAMQDQRQKMAKMVEVAKAAPVDLLRTEVRWPPDPEPGKRNQRPGDPKKALSQPDGLGILIRPNSNLPGNLPSRQ